MMFRSSQARLIKNYYQANQISASNKAHPAFQVVFPSSPLIINRRPRVRTEGIINLSSKCSERSLLSSLVLFAELLTSSCHIFLDSTMELLGNYSFNEKTNSYKFTVNQVVDRRVGNSVVRVSGEHINDRTRKDVDTVSIFNIDMRCIPDGLGGIFPNLETLSVVSCELDRITKEDLKGLKNLKHLALNGNKITRLPDNLFIDTPQIETISFYGNRIKYIGRATFDPLTNLSYANFKLNTNIDICYKTFGNGVSLETLRARVEENCRPKYETAIIKYLHEIFALFILTIP